MNMSEQKLELRVPDMSCGHCVAAVTQAIKQLDPDADVSVSLDDKRVSVSTTEDRDAVAACLAEAGYPVAR
jgi:copper chaperone